MKVKVLCSIINLFSYQYTSISGRMSNFSSRHECHEDVSHLTKKYRGAPDFVHVKLSFSSISEKKLSERFWWMKKNRLE